MKSGEWNGCRVSWDAGCRLALAHFRLAVDNHFRDVRQQLGRTVLPNWQLEQLRLLIEETSGDSAGEEIGVGNQVEKERDVGFHAADAEFLQTPLHPTGGINEAQAVGRHFHQQRVIKRRDHRSGKSRAGVQADTHATG